TLLQHRRSRWQQSPYLLTANTPLEEGNTVEDDEDDAPEKKQEAPKKE
ncbi:YtjB family periplasmic protein, partial [Serratia nevei]